MLSNLLFDPKLFDAGDYNLFRYCHNDPVDFTDAMGTLEQYHAELAHSPDRLSEMTKWFDRSNLIQGNFPGFGLTLGLTERDAKGQVSEKTGGGVTLRPRYRQMNEEKLAGLDPRFAPMAQRFVDAANAEVNPQGLEVRISHGTRSLAEQDELYRRYLADGKYKAAAPGRSAHNYGMAIDIAVIRGSALIDRHSMWTRLGRLGESLGLRWGHGFDDDDHFQHTGIPTSGTQLLRLHSQGRDVLTGEPLD